MAHLSVLLLRLTVGGLLAGHGAQKLFGWFGGPGLEGTTGWLESMGLKPGKLWASKAGLGEFGGGMLTALGLGGPLGPIMVISAMLMASIKGHWGKPIWVSEGGAELPVTNIGVATALALSGPGRYSLDQLFGIRVPRWLSVLFALGALGAVAYGAMLQPDEAAQPETEQGEQAA